MHPHIELAQRARDLAMSGDIGPSHLLGYEMPRANRYYPFLYHLAGMLKPRRTVELGVRLGTSLAHLVSGVQPGCEVMGVDHTKDTGGSLEYLVTIGNSIDTAATHGPGRPIDLLFIDATKSIDEWVAWRPFCADDVVVCLDDRRTEGKGLWASIGGTDKLELDELHGVLGGQVHGFGVFVGRDDAP